MLAARSADRVRAAAALGELCATYWPPLYAYVRRTGASTHDACDLVQGLFEQLLRSGGTGGADPARGRFRSYLLGALKHHMANARDHADARKRGGGAVKLAIDIAAEERRLDRAAVDGESPERAFDRRWAVTVLSVVTDRLRDDYAAKGKENLFEALRPFLTRDPQAGAQVEAARALGVTSGAFKVALHRLRERYRDALRREVGRTTSSDDEIDDEISALMRALATAV